MAKQKYYRLNNINKTGANYQILLGERSNGKSYAVKEKMLFEAYFEKDFFSGEKLQQSQFAYVRRWDRDFVGGGYLDFFNDFVCDDNGKQHLLEMTNGEYSDINYYRGKYYFANNKWSAKYFMVFSVFHLKSIIFRQCYYNNQCFVCNKINF